MMKLDNIYPNMTEKEITELIKFSPTNLPAFFDDTMHL